jgi:hypothetical protein
LGRCLSAANCVNAMRKSLFKALTSPKSFLN